jgi:hypothetical protein
MKKIIDNFYITIENTTKEFENEQYRMTKATKNSSSKYNFEYAKVPDYKNYEFMNAFGYINSQYLTLTNEILDVIEFIEILKAFANNKLTSGKLYELSFFTAKYKNCEESKTTILSIKLSTDLFIKYDKAEALILSAKLSKAISKCEVIFECEVI